MLAAGDKVTSYVAIRADEDYREGYAAKADNLFVKLPFREAGIDKAGVIDILENSGVGYLSRPGRFFGRFLNKSGDLARQDLRASRGV